jgi:hypothetical protein
MVKDKTAGDEAPEITTTALHGIALEAAVWGTPLVSFEAMRQAYFRDAQAEYGDVVYWSQPADWKLQITTPNASTRYAWIQLNTHGGPVVLEIPPAKGAGLFGSIVDAWQVPAIDVGPAGEDEGKGGKYLVMPPGYTGDIPTGYVPIRLETYNAYVALRAIPEGSSPADIERALALVKKVNVYPFSETDASPPHQAQIDMTGKYFDGIVRFDESFFANLARMIEEERPNPRDTAMHQQLALLGIEKGKPFAPEGPMQLLLRSAALDAHSHFTRQLPLSGTAYWPEGTWRTPSPVGMETGFTFVDDQGELDAEERGLMFYVACAPPAKLGAATMYLLAYVDRSGQILSGDASYTLHVPANVPARQFWACTVYDISSATFMRESPRVEVSSFDERLRKNADGSVDLYFGPSAPPGHETNWIPTSRGRQWFAMFRFYGPEEAVFAKTWRLGDLQKLRGGDVRH